MESEDNPLTSTGRVDDYWNEPILIPTIDKHKENRKDQGKDNHWIWLEEADNHDDDSIRDEEKKDDDGDTDKDEKEKDENNKERLRQQRHRRKLWWRWSCLRWRSWLITGEKV